MIYRCFNPRCSGKPAQHEHLEFSSSARLCPSCGATGDAIVPILVHHWIRPAESGRVVGQFGCKFAVACKPDMSQEALSGRVQMTTPEVFAVNCPACMATAEWIEAALPLYEKATSGLAEVVCASIAIPARVHDALKGKGATNGA